MIDQEPRCSMEVQKQALAERRAKLLRAFPETPLVLANGEARPAHTPSFSYPFRGDSSFMYFFGKAPKGCFALFEGGAVSLFLKKPPAEVEIWSGSSPSLKELAEHYLVDDAVYIDQLPQKIRRFKDKILFLDPACPQTQKDLKQLVGRSFAPEEKDASLIEYIANQRLIHDQWGRSQLEQVAQFSADIHSVLLQALCQRKLSGKTLYEALAILEYETRRRGLRAAFAPIVTCHGEVLHNTSYQGEVECGSLLLVDFGVELASGYAGDITRVWPVSGKFSSAQRNIYLLVLEMQRVALSSLCAGAMYADVHQAATHVLLQGLLDLGLVRGSLDELNEKDVQRIFFPHGIGHPLGMDVHDLELFGAKILNPTGNRFIKNLRFNRKLGEGMCLTVEPGIYFIPSLLQKEGSAHSCLNHSVLNKYLEVRGIRVEDNILLGADYESNLNLTISLPKGLGELERLLAQS